RSEEEIKREVTEQMGALIASGEAVPLSAIEGVTAQQAEALAAHDINDIDALAQTSVDDLVEYLDVSLDEAETILNAAKAVTAMRDRSMQEAGDEEEGELETHAVSAELDESIETSEVEPSDDMTESGYDEAVETGVPYSAEPEIRAWDSADPVAVTEAEPITSDEIVLQEPGRDLRPDTITPSPDITSTGVAALDNINEITEDLSEESLTAAIETASEESESEAEILTPAEPEDAAPGESSDEEKQ
ncbi:MAG TPA: helix-hairpin-helix domain-containing protein, partial [Pyrinomonadaceae bacterium]